MAQKLAALAQALGNGGIPFEVRRTSPRSPWYITFLCPDSGV
jgi:hypothetical protein